VVVVAWFDISFGVEALPGYLASRQCHRMVWPRRGAAHL